MAVNFKILILEGGHNEEHEVSLNSSLEVQKVLKYLKIKFKTLMVKPQSFEKKISKYKDYLVFNALHGTFGEDGQVQKILKKNNIRFTHSSFLSSKKCFNKIIAKNIVKKNNILTPKFTILKKEDINIENILILKKKYKKIVIKPSSSGSSYGIKIIKNKKDFENLINKIKKFKNEFQFHDEILIEEFIEGKELTVSTIKFSGTVNALAVTEIKTKNKFFDYQAKYSKGYAKHIIPANINVPTYKKCLVLATKCHKLLKCKSIARTDFILSSENKIYFLETNTQPGLTSISLLPEQAKYKNIRFLDLIMGILKNIN